MEWLERRFVNNSAREEDLFNTTSVDGSKDSLRGLCNLSLGGDVTENVEEVASFFTGASKIEKFKL